jgi:protein tyrosine/serine phosphatase
MNNDLYLIKYLKYKKKYLNEKNKIGGADCESSLQSTVKNKLEKLDPIKCVPDLFTLLKDKAGDLTIGKILNNIRSLNTLVYELKKLNKECLKSVLTKYLDSQEVQTKLSEFSEFTFSNLKIKSFNINEDENNKFEKKIDVTKIKLSNDPKIKLSDDSIIKLSDDPKIKFSRGTASIFSNNTKQVGMLKKKNVEVYERNLLYLTNIFEIEFDAGNEKKIKSLRFGTPYAPEDSKDFYKDQVDTLNSYIKESDRKCLFISLMDICDSSLCVFGGEKANENSIAHAEIEGYINEEKIAYLNMQCNNSVNLKDTLSVVSDKDLKGKLYKYFERLDSWLFEDKSIVLQKLRNNDNFFDKFRENVLDNFSSDPELVRKLSLQRFVLTKEDEENILNEENPDETIKNDFMTKYSPCLEDVTNENIRLVMFCYISLIFYILSINNPNKYILLYHCKSGQDRTGTVFAINQMVNEITKNNYEEIIKLINEGTSFVDIFIKFYSLTPNHYKISKDKKFCPTDPISELLHKSVDSNINKVVELCYLRYLLFSYIITITSTGCPGMKWGIYNKESKLKLVDKRTYDTDSSVGNRFPFLLLLNPWDVHLFSGAGVMRGS